MEYNEGMIPNKNRIIQISRSNVSSSKGYWYNTFSGIFQEGGFSGNSIIGSLSGELSKWDACVPLLMDDNSINPMSDISYTPKTPIKDFLSGNGGVNTGIPSVDKVINGGLSKKIGDAGKLLVDGMGVADNFTNGGGKTSSYTAQTYYPWIQSIPTFDPSTLEPPTLSCSFKFNMGQYGLWNAKEEVFKPIINLMSMVMPREITSAIAVKPPYPSTVQLFTEVVQTVFTDWKDIGSDFLSGVGDAVSNVSFSGGVKEAAGSLVTAANSVISEIADVLEALLTSSYKNFTYDITYGNTFTFYDMLPISISGVSFSSETDQYGFPVSGSIGIGFKGIKPYSLSSRNGNVAMRFGGNR